METPITPAPAPAPTTPPPTGDIAPPSTQGELSNQALDSAKGAADDMRVFQTELANIQIGVSISNSSFQSMIAILDKASNSSIR